MYNFTTFYSSILIRFGEYCVLFSSMRSLRREKLLLNSIYSGSFDKDARVFFFFLVSMTSQHVEEHRRLIFVWIKNCSVYVQIQTGKLSCFAIIYRTNLFLGQKANAQVSASKL